MKAKLRCKATDLVASRRKPSLVGPADLDRFWGPEYIGIIWVIWDSCRALGLGIVL